MSKTMFADKPPEDRLRLLMDNCDNREETKYMKDLSQDELDSKRESITDNYIKVNDLEDELAAKKAEFKLEIDPLKMENKQLLLQIKTRKEEVRGVLFHFADHEEGFMNTYDEMGELVTSRRLRPDEKQGRLFIAPGGKVASGE